MNSILNLTVKQLRKAADLQERIEALQDKMQQVLGPPAPTEAPAARGRKKRKLSRKGLANIRAGVRKRMKARARGAAQPATVAVKRRRKISAAGRRALSAAAKARWARVKAAGKSRL